MTGKIYLFIVFVFILFSVSACSAKNPQSGKSEIEAAPISENNNDKTVGNEEKITPDKKDNLPEPQHAWIYAANGLIAHAGGSIEGFVGTNTRDAIIENYKLGHRVFEIDFNLTTDGRLVCVHDWPSYSGPLSAEDFLKIKIADRYTAIELKDIFELMMTYEDMYIVTDTKSFEYTDAETFLQFEQFYELANEFDLSLLDRIIPQIYDQKTYQVLKNVYPFKSVIYTLYASPDTDEEIVSFVKDKEDIAVITMGPVRYSENFYNELLRYDKHIYFFTLNSLEEITEAKNKGVHGFYTDSVIPGDLKE